jgi:hypothetical protein
MTINAATPIIGGTFAAPTGGTADQLSAFGGKSEMIARFDADTEYLTSKEAVFTVKEPTVSANAPGGYTQARTLLLLKFPRVLDNGNRTVDTLRVELSVDPEATSSEIDEYMLVGSQFCADPDFAEVWRKRILE